MRTYTFKLFGKSVFAVYSHYLMMKSYKRNEKKENSNVEFIRVTKKSEMMEGVYSSETAYKLMTRNEGLCECFVLVDTKQEVLGTVSVMYKGGDDLEYRIRDIEAFVYNVYVAPMHRGKGYAGIMLSELINYLHEEKKIDCAYLAVSTNNDNAINAYKKNEWIIKKKRTFIRLLRVNIPYYSI